MPSLYTFFFLGGGGGIKQLKFWCETNEHQNASYVDLTPTPPPSWKYGQKHVVMLVHIARKSIICHSRVWKYEGKCTQRSVHRISINSALRALIIDAGWRQSVFEFQIKGVKVIVLGYKTIFGPGNSLCYCEPTIVRK